MGLVNIDDLRPGMVLSHDLTTPDGRFLIPMGTELNQGHIKTCKAWGVTQAGVQGQDQSTLNAAKMASIAPEVLKQSKKLIKPYVRREVLDNKVMVEIVRIAVEQLALNIQSGQYESSNQDTGVFVDCNNIAPGTNPVELSALRMVREQTELISLPDIFYRILEVLESPFSSAKHVADVVSKDSSLSAKLLRLVNSAFYGFPSKIDSISRAVAILGTKELTSLAMGIALIKVFEGIPQSVINMEKFWRHSISCGVYSSLIYTRMMGQSEERFFVAGLIHDIGRLIMLKSEPELCMSAICHARNKKIPLHRAEQEVIGFDHALMGGTLCREWKMPVGLEKMVRYHHEPVKARNISEASTVYLANIISMVMNPGMVYEGFFPALCEKSWESLRLDRSDLGPIVKQAEKSVSEIVEIFLRRQVRT
ncbi:MAG: HDOD domain-containing protein [Desulfonatronovibrio sp. MSAO_Bac4]|nr:MAG: HDOD domain-containing protein [Desulfonatronovibrio sp. MSAO_Bac4]